MKRDRTPEMRLYEWDIARWVTSRTRAELNPVGRYIYRELLDLCHAQGKMSRDHETLARYCGVEAGVFEASWPKIARHFHVDKHDSESLVNDFASVARKSYFKYVKQQQRNRKKRGSVNCNGNNGMHYDGSTTGATTVQPPLHTLQDKTRQDTTRQDTTTTGSEPHTQLNVSEWPLATAAVTDEFTATDSALMLQIIQAGAMACADAGLNLTDEILQQAIREARGQTPKQYNAALYLTTVPKVVANWAREAKRRSRG